MKEVMLRLIRIRNLGNELPSLDKRALDRHKPNVCKGSSVVLLARKTTDADGSLVPLRARSVPQETQELRT